MKMTLKDIGNGGKFENVSCILKEFRRGSREQFDVAFNSDGITRFGYVKSNLFSYEQLQGLCGKTVVIAGLHEPGLEGVKPERLKIKNIEPFVSDNPDDYLMHTYHIDAEHLDMYEANIKKYASHIGSFVPAYKKLVDAYLSKENIALMRTMPATHCRQGSPMGGMLHATYSVLHMVYYMGMCYISSSNGLHSFKEKRALNWDLLLTAAIVHLSGNFLYFEKEIPHTKTCIGVEQGFNQCRQMYLTSLCKECDVSVEDMASLLGVMSRLNEQNEGIKKCRQETALLHNAYHTFLELDEYDYATCKYINDTLEQHKNDKEDYEFSSYAFLESVNCYVSKDELQRKCVFIKRGVKKDAI